MIHYLTHNWSTIKPLLIQHIMLSLTPTIIGILIAVPLGALAVQTKKLAWLKTLLPPAAIIIFTIPSLTLFLTLPTMIGTKILDPINVIVALTIYSICLLIRNVLDSFSNIDIATIESARSIGLSPMKIFMTIIFPLSLPALIAGIRVTAMSNISMVSAGSVIGIGGLGQLFTSGYEQANTSMIMTGVILVILIAVVVDQIIKNIGTLATPWNKINKTVGVN